MLPPIALYPGHMYQGALTNISKCLRTITAICLPPTVDNYCKSFVGCESVAREARLLGGSGGMPPRNFRPSEIVSGAILG